MYRFLLYSLILHLVIVALLFASTLFTPKPKHIQIQLALLPKNNNVKKAPPPPVEVSKPEPKKETPEEAKKREEKVAKLLDKVLQEDVAEKHIEKSVPQKEVSPELEKIKEPPKEISKKVENKVSKQPEIIKNPQPKKNEVKQEVAPVHKLQKKQELPVHIPMQSPTVIDSKPNPYANPVMPSEPVEVAKPINNPYANPIIPVEDNSIVVHEVAPAPSLPQSIPKRKEVDVSSVKDESVSHDAIRITNDNSGLSNDIMSSEAFYLSNNDKKALMNQMSQCLASLGMIRENNETVTLLIEMKEDAKIKDINVIKNNKIVPKSDLSNLESRILYLFNNPKCSKLILPEGKFNYWKKFTIKLNLKGLFG